MTSISCHIAAALQLGVGRRLALYLFQEVVDVVLQLLTVCGHSKLSPTSRNTCHMSDNEVKKHLSYSATHLLFTDFLADVQSKRCTVRHMPVQTTAGPLVPVTRTACVSMERKRHGQSSALVAAYLVQRLGSGTQTKRTQRCPRAPAPLTPPAPAPATPALAPLA